MDNGKRGMTTTTADWVSAAPFRAHVLSLMSQTGLPWRTIAIAADVPSPAMRTLLFGRAGKSRPFLYGPHARRLLALSGDSLRMVAGSPRRSTPSRQALQHLMAAGMDLDRIVAATGLRREEMESILAGRRWCTGLVDLILRSLADRHRLDVDDELIFQEAA